MKISLETKNINFTCSNDLNLSKILYPQFYESNPFIELRFDWSKRIAVIWLRRKYPKCTQMIQVICRIFVATTKPPTNKRKQFSAKVKKKKKKCVSFNYILNKFYIELDKDPRLKYFGKLIWKLEQVFSFESNNVRANEF